ncbi:DNA repair protein RecO [Ampullimonas aquatilis]|uniref:DNA repair protein RecO n=1 Tax=Ampullimonas aquatilis TaxID=1341549 RepID=UPI003C7969CD
MTNPVKPDDDVLVSEPLADPSRMAPIAQQEVASATTPRRVRSARPKPQVSEIRIGQEPGYVLHSYPYKETSLILDFFSRHHGRIALIAKGAKRPHSALRSVLQLFQPILASWTGRGEVRTLTKAEWAGMGAVLRGDGLLCGFYLNELIVKLCAREDPHPGLFDRYAAALVQLAHVEQNNQSYSAILRAFEYTLLAELGHAASFHWCHDSDETVEPSGQYVFVPEEGVCHAASYLAQYPQGELPVVLGQTLLDIEAEHYDNPTTLMQSKWLMRHILQHHLGNVTLNTRQILIDLHNL